MPLGWCNTAGKRKETGCLLALLLFNAVKQTGIIRFVILLCIFCFVKRVELFEVVLGRVAFVSKELYPIVIIVTTGINVGQVCAGTSFVGFRICVFTLIGRRVFV